MKKIRLIILTIATACSITAVGGNEDRAGEAGATQLLINPWTNSVGWGGANTASAIGLEAMSLNIAGLAFTKKTELIVNHKRYLSGSDIGINTFGFSQRVGETSVLALSMMSMDFGQIDVTTVDNPEGKVATFSPTLTMMDLGFAKNFSNSISGGLGLRVISESLANVSSRGYAFDAGIRYIAGENDEIKFGIALKNVGPTMKYSGDGLSFFAATQNAFGNDVFATNDHRAAEFQLPSLLNIGASYDFYLVPTVDSTDTKMTSDHMITGAVNFTSNSFTKDQYRFGAEYSYKKMFMLRVGYVLEQGTWFSSEKRTSANIGPAFGTSFVAPLGDSGSTLGFNYAYQVTENFSGTHSIGIRLDL